MGKIVDTELNPFGKIIDNGSISISNQDIDNIFNGKGATLSLVYLNNPNKGDLPTGSYNLGYFKDVEDVFGINGVFQIDGENTPAIPALFSGYIGTGATLSLVALQPEGLNIFVEDISINEQITFSGDVNVSGTTFSIVNGFIVNVIQ